METPFEIGKTYYLPQMNPYQVKVPCYVCNGKKVVTVTDGWGVSWDVQCEGCGLGFEGPRGFVNEYAYTPSVKEFTVYKVNSFHADGSWYLVSMQGDSSDWSSLRMTPEEAEQDSAKRLREIETENHRRSATSKQTMLNKATWSLRYHRECLAKLDREREYHQAKIQEQERKP